MAQPWRNRCPETGQRRLLAWGQLRRAILCLVAGPPGHDLEPEFVDRLPDLRELPLDIRPHTLDLLWARGIRAGSSGSLLRILLLRCLLGNLLCGLRGVVSDNGQDAYEGDQGDTEPADHQVSGAARLLTLLSLSPVVLARSVALPPVTRVLVTLVIVSIPVTAVVPL